MKEKEDPIAFLLRLSLELAERETKGEPLAPPGLPASVTDSEEFTTADCIEPR